MSNTVVGNAFADAKYLYDQNKNNFYIPSIDIGANETGTEHTFLHLAYIPSYRSKIFSEYLPSKLDDVKYLYDNLFDKKIFKSFYCSLCASKEPNNVTLIKNTSIGPTLTPSPNLSAEIRYSIIIRGIKLLITGTADQYLVDHLLLFPENHQSNYLFMLNSNSFSSIYDVLTHHAPANTVAHFNGNFGSDIHHAHVHLTSQPPYIVEFCKERIKLQNKSFDIINLESIALGALLIYDNDLERLHRQASKYYRIYFDPIFNYNKYFVSTTHFVVARADKLGYIYAIIIIIGELGIKSLTVGNCSVKIIAPAYLLIADCEDIDDIIVKNKNMYLSGKEIFKLGNRTRSIEEMNPLPIEVNLVLSEIVEYYLFRDQLPVDPTNDARFNIYRKLLDLYDDMGCSARNVDTCKYHQFGAYKIFFTLWLILTINRVRSLFNNKPNSGNRSLEDAIASLYNDPQILNAAISSEYYKLRYTYKLNTDSLVLRGDIANSIARDTFATLLKIAAPDNINKWLKYNKDSIGTSSYGYVTKAILDNDQTTPFAIKAIKTTANTSYEHELKIGQRMSLYRAYIPNFAMTYGGTSCLSASDYSSLCTLTSTNSERFNYILMEYISGGSLGDFVSNFRYQPSLEIILLYVIQQASIALAFAQETDEFTHYDAHAKNILLTESSNKQFVYKGKKDSYTIYAPYTVVFIDYGTAHIKGLADYPVSPFKESYGMTIEKFKISADIYTILTDILILIIAYNSDYLTSPKIEALYRIYDRVYGGLYSKPIADLINEGYNAKDDYLTFYKRLKMARLDKRAPLYLPHDYDNKFGPLNLYEEIKKILGIDHRPKDYTLCYWGNIRNSGCV